SKTNFTSQITANGNAKHNSYAPFYGENKTSDYIIFGLNAGYSFWFEKTSLSLKAGVENIFDCYYNSFDDWINITRSVRNVYIVLCLIACYSFRFEKTSLSLKAGVENIFDRYYTSFADWNNIPRTGRNVYLNVVFGL